MKCVVQVKDCQNKNWLEFQFYLSSSFTQKIFFLLRWRRTYRDMFGSFDHFRHLIVFELFVTRLKVRRSSNFRQFWDFERDRNSGSPRRRLSFRQIAVQLNRTVPSAADCLIPRRKRTPSQTSKGSPTDNIMSGVSLMTVNWGGLFFGNRFDRRSQKKDDW